MQFHAGMDVLFFEWLSHIAGHASVHYCVVGAMGMACRTHTALRCLVGTACGSLMFAFLWLRERYVCCLCLGAIQAACCLLS